jgi:hypothetical protein
MNKLSSIFATCVATLFVSIAFFGSGPVSATENPPAEGFDQEGSDQKAIAIADQVMETLGGRAAWDDTRFLTWNFFGRRRHVWDKQTGDIRVEGVRRDDEKPYVILMNIHSMQGRVWVDGQEVSDPDELAELLDLGEAAWINDAYWVFMPYKLKDSGVTLRHVGTDAMVDGRRAQVLQLTFEDVGRTPENKYLIYVAEDSGLVEQWDYFAEAGDTEPEFQIPWHDWQQFGNIMLSDNRGKNGHTDIAVLQSLPAAVLNSPEPVDWATLIP